MAATESIAKEISELSKQSIENLLIKLPSIAQQEFRAAVKNHSISEISLSYNRDLTDEHVKVMVAILPYTKVRSLSLKGVVGLTDVSARALATNESLTELCIGYTRIGDEGAKALAQHKTLTSLYINHTCVSDKGIEALTENPRLVSLETWGCKISDASEKKVTAMLFRNKKAVTSTKLFKEQLKKADEQLNAYRQLTF